MFDILVPEPYSIILADPPWRYDFAPSKSRKIENQYPTMALTDIAALDVQSIAEKNSVLYLWATAPKLIEALTVMRCWGFKYKTQGVWTKRKLGMGYWFRNQHEIVLVGTRGKMSPPQQSRRFSSLIHGKHTTHSRKPETLHLIIEQGFDDRPSLRKLEMFAREERKGWDVFGNEMENGVHIPVRKNASY